MKTFFQPIVSMPLDPSLQGSAQVQRLIGACQRMETVIRRSIENCRVVAGIGEVIEQKHNLMFQDFYAFVPVKDELNKILEDAYKLAKSHHPFVSRVATDLKTLAEVQHRGYRRIPVLEIEEHSHLSARGKSLHVVVSDFHSDPLHDGLLAFLGIHLEPMINITLKTMRSNHEFWKTPTPVSLETEIDVGLGAVAALGLQWYPPLLRDLKAENGFFGTGVRRIGNRIEWQRPSV